MVGLAEGLVVGLDVVGVADGAAVVGVAVGAAVVGAADGLLLGGTVGVDPSEGQKLKSPTPSNWFLAMTAHSICLSLYVS